MLSISTAYAMYRCRTWHELLETTKELGFGALELNVEVPGKWFPEIYNSVKRGEITVSSLHNYSPKIEALPPGRTIYSGFRLTSDDIDERRSAVHYTLRTIEWAKNLGAGVVVLHAGDIPTDPLGGEVYAYARKFGLNGKLYHKYVTALFSDRKAKSAKYMDLLKKGLEPVVKAAEKAKVVLGIENRMYGHEIPDISETSELLNEFGSAVGYWHDTGHAEVFVRMGFVKSHEEILRALGDKIVGFHLHDMLALSDHNTPGTGDFDFGALKPYMKNGVVKVIEAHPKTDWGKFKKHLKKSIKYLESKGIY
jgi:sugar phosphate isomerase/epimerase